MANDFTVKVEDHTPEFLMKLDSTIETIMEEWGLAAEGFAIDEISKKVYDTEPSPNYKRTGRLRASITYTTKHNHDEVRKEASSEDAVKASPNAGEVYVGTNVEYARWVETGTSRMPPRPFIRPAVANHADDYKKIAENRLQNS